jgi:GT2 family glycosyltransferase
VLEPKTDLPPDPPLLSGVVVHWHNEDLLAELAAAWPRDPRFELVVVDNGSGAGELRLPEGTLLVSPGRNLGFAGGANAGIAAARAPLLLILNPDALPELGALDELLRGFEVHGEAAGLAPRLAGPDGAPQFAWQLRDLPSPWSCLGQVLLLPGRPTHRVEPPPGTPVAQPAAAALALRRSALAEVDGFDAGFYPAWFEDVDLAKRLQAAGQVLRYWPAARFRHRLGSSVPRLGYGTFLWVYYRNLTRYLAKHHGRAWAWAARALLPLGLGLRLLLLPLRRPRRATSRAEAGRGLLDVMAGAVTGWRRPARLAARESFP